MRIRKKPSQKKLNGSTVKDVAAILKRGEPTIFAFEGAVRHSLRSFLCLRGVGWHEADHDAAEVVRLAYVRLQIRRPSWLEGQPGFVKSRVRVELIAPMKPAKR